MVFYYISNIFSNTSFARARATIIHAISNAPFARNPYETRVFGISTALPCCCWVAVNDSVVFSISTALLLLGGCAITTTCDASCLALYFISLRRRGFKGRGVGRTQHVLTYINLGITSFLLDS